MHTQAVAPDGRQAPEEPRRRDARTPRRRLLADRVARYCVVLGGMAIIASIMGILVFILVEVAPLLGGASVQTERVVEVDAASPGAILSDDYRTRLAVVSRDGRLQVVDTASGEVLMEDRLAGGDGEERSQGDPSATPDSVIDVTTSPGQSVFVAATRLGLVVARPLDWKITFDGSRRRVTPELEDPIVFEMAETPGSLGAFTAAVSPDGNATGVAVLEDGRIALTSRRVEENLFTGEIDETWSRDTVTPPFPIDLLLIDAAQRNLYGANADGQLVRFKLDDGEFDELDVAQTDHGAVTALSLLIGHRSLVVGHEDGTISVWFDLRSEEGGAELTWIREFHLGDAPIRYIAPSRRDKGFLAVDLDAHAGLFYSTSERTLWRGSLPVDRVEAVTFAPKADAGYFADAGRIAELSIDNPYPEVSWTALFGKVWYEGYPEPQYVWQSSGGTDDFESKLGLTPLMVGTLKGTIYSLFLAIPLGVLGAMYTSQFMHSSLRRYVKPTVEIMAALPSVVLGFLAGLWLAPRIEQLMPALFLMLILTPLLVVLGGLAWRGLPAAVRDRLPDGSEVILQLVFVAGAIWISMSLNEPVEGWVFGGSFQDWLLQATGLQYDQRNAIIVGLAMGFAVIPIIFSIAEDAFSNVPRSLVSGSLALGASPWQTVTRIVLPSASPGIFSAIMIGFGRAIGETMIVLMATGNTPIMDWNPFNGFRTLSANIAVEIPEAPQGATLYRTLFLAALILFIFTFLTNTVAELVRQRLRRRYAQL